MNDMHVYGPLLLSLGIPLLFVYLLGQKSSIARVVAVGTCVIMSSRYLWWRYNISIPTNQDFIRTAWAWTFFAFEAATITSSMAVYVFMSRFLNRTPEVDRRPNSPMLSAPVDVFIATYNEDYEILERTIVGACAILHADLRVWVLDDGNRAWVRELAEEMGAHYVFRIKGKHAKAGNVNNGLEVALSTGRRPEFILLLDADFVANRMMLKRTLPLFEEEDVGIVQTPQHFFNPDPMQSNLMCAGAWPDEQRFFFNYLLASKDAWGAAFCCGTSAVFRTAAFDAAGGMATETVTEDMLTTFRFGEHGYRTVFLNEELSLGLAPEGLKEYVSQRSRWCLGAVQQVYTRWSFLGFAKIGIVNRLSSLDGVMYWSFGFPFKIMMISAPLIYWWTGTAVITSNIDDLLFWLLPAVVSGMVFMAQFAGNRVLPVMTDVSQLLSSFSITRTVATAIFKPFGHPFKVTAKGVSTTGITIQWQFLTPFVFLAAGTVGGMVINMGPYSPLNGTPGYSVNIFWSVFNVMVLVIAGAVCIELPKRRRDERFTSGESASLVMPSGEKVECTVTDISLGGARFHRSEEWDLRPGIGTATLSGMLPGDLPVEIRFDVIRLVDGDLAVHFHQEKPNRRALIVKLFTGSYRNEVTKVRLGQIAKSVIRRMFD